MYSAHALHHVVAHFESVASLRSAEILHRRSVSATVAFLLPPEEGGDGEVFSNLSQPAGSIMPLASFQLTHTRYSNCCWDIRSDSLGFTQVRVGSSPQFLEFLYKEVFASVLKLELE